MPCRGKYLWGFFHQWGKWEDFERAVKSVWLDGYTSSSVQFLQIKTCTRCGKKKLRKLN